VICFRQQSISLWGLVVLSAALAGCKAKTQASAAQPSDKSQYEPVVIRFSDPGNGGSGGILAYARREGILDRELAKVNAKIEWVSAFGAFSANFEAMNTGAINASGGAISPIVGALAHNLKFKVFAIADPSAQLQAGIIVPGDSPIKKLKDLVGKRVAVNLAAHGDYILLKALTNEGISIDSVNRVPTPNVPGVVEALNQSTYTHFDIAEVRARIELLHDIRATQPPQELLQDPCAGGIEGLDARTVDDQC